MNDNLEFRELKNKELIPYDLLLMADPDKHNIDRYILNSVIITINKDGGTIGCYVLCKVDEDTIEIKNISIRSDHQGQGFGKILLNHAVDRARSDGFKMIIIGTGNSSIGQLYLYQKAGFRVIRIIPDFFIDHYDAPIIENGIECRDMIVLARAL